MRVLVLRQQTDLDALKATLLQPSSGGAAGQRAIERLQQLNPHVDVKKLKPGTVLFLPDTLELRPNAAPAAGATDFGDLRELIMSELGAAGARLDQGHARLTAERTAVNAALKTAAVKRAVDADPELKRKVETAVEVMKQDPKAAKDAKDAFERLSKGVAAELDALATLLG